MKVCLTADVVDAGESFPRGLIGRVVLGVGSRMWLVEFKYPDSSSPDKVKRVYAQVSSRDLQVFDEAARQSW